jgi:hypothetical protein
MLFLFILLGILLLLQGRSWIIRIQINIDKTLALDNERRMLNVQIIPFSKLSWKKQYRMETDHGELLQALLKSLSRKRQHMKTPRWTRFLSTAQKITLARRLISIGYRAARWTVIKNLEWRTSLGAEDAMLTGLGVGAFWALKGITVSIISSVMSLEKLRLDVEPDFTHERFWTRFSGIFQLKAAHIILIGTCLIIWMFRGYWYGITARKRTKPSHRRVMKMLCRVLKKWLT